MTDVDAEGNPMNYGQNADQTREFVEIVPGNQTIHLMNWNDYPFKIHKNSTTTEKSTMPGRILSIIKATTMPSNARSTNTISNVIGFRL